MVTDYEDLSHCADIEAKIWLEVGRYLAPNVLAEAIEFALYAQPPEYPA